MKFNAVFFVVLIFFSCSNNKKNEITLKSPSSLIMEPVEIPKELFRPSKVIASEKHFIVFNNVDKQVFNVFSPELELLYTFGDRGQGPNEFNQVIQESFELEGNEFSVLDMNSFVTYQLGDSTAHRKDKQHIASEQSIFNKAKKLSKDSFIFLPYSYNENQSDIKKYNFKDGKIEDFGEKMSIKPEEIEKPFLLSSILSVNKKKQRVAQFYQHKPEFKIYNFEGKLLHKGAISIEQTDENRLYFAEIYTTDSFIYVLWINSTKEGVMKNIDMFRPELLVLDWEGNFLEQFKFNIPVISFAVTPDNKTIVASSLKETDASKIYKAKLP